MTARLEDALAFYAEPSTAASGRAPFRFLDAYEREDREYFFGRDAELEDLRSRFYRSRVFVVYGESGAGKTSLLQCGLANAIPEEDAEFHFIRSHIDPFAAVRQRLGEGAAQRQSLPVLIDARARRASRTVALVFDQFEELFLFQAVEVRQRLLDELREALNRRLDVRLVFCLREEFLSRMTEVEATIPDVFANRFWLRRMRASDARGVVDATCRRAGIAIEDGLSALLIERLRDPRGDIDLPYLQIMLDRLYRRALERGEPLHFDRKDIEALGSMEEILSGFLEARVRELAFPDLGRNILKLFVTAAHTRKAVDAVTIARGVSATTGLRTWPPTLVDQASQAVQTTLHALVQARILRQDDVDAPYELRHDTLAEAIARWLTPLEEEQVKLRSLIENRYAEYLSTGALIQDRKLLARIEPHLGKLGLPPEMNDLVRRSLAMMSTTSRRRVLIIGTLLVVVAATLAVMLYYIIHAALAAQQDRAQIALLQEQSVERGLITRVRELEAEGRTDAALALIWSRQQEGDPVFMDKFHDYEKHHVSSRVLDANPAAGWSPLNPDGTTVLVQHGFNLERVRIATGQTDGVPLVRPGGKVVMGAYTADGSRLALALDEELRSGGRDMRFIAVALWPTGWVGPTIRSDLRDGDGHVTAMAFARDGTLLVATDQNELFAITGARDKTRLGGLDDSITVLSPAPTNDGVAVGDRAGTVRLWREGKLGAALPQARCKATAADTPRAVVDIRWSPTGDRLFALTGTGPRGWHVDGPQRTEIALACDAGNLGDPTALALSSNGQRLAVGDSNGGVRFWRVDGSEPPRYLPRRERAYPHHAPISALLFTADDGLVVGDESGSLSIWDPVTNLITRLEGHTGRIASLKLAQTGPDIMTLVSTEDHGAIHLWHIAFTARHPAPERFDATFDADIEELLVAPGRDRSVVVMTRGGRPHIVSTETGLEGESFSVDNLSIYRHLLYPKRSPNGRFEVAHDNTGRITIFELPQSTHLPLDVGVETNLRPCPGSFRIVPILPFPPASQRWADLMSCSTASP